MSERPQATKSVFRASIALAQRLFLVAACFVLPLGSVRAQTARTWTGLGANTSWQTAANWSGGVAPVANDTLIFGSAGVAVRPVANNNFPVGTNFGAILITSGGYSLTGNAVVVGDVVRASHVTGTTTLSLVIGGAARIEMTGAGTLSLSGANTFSGGVVIQAGTVAGATTATALGAASGVITLGHTSGSENATLRVGFAGTTANPIVVAAGSTGNTLSITNTANATLSGAVVINHDVVFAPTLTSSLVVSGGVTGTGDVRVLGTGTTASLTFSTNAVNVTGRIVNQGTNTGTTSITGGIGANVREISLESNTSALSVTTQPITIGALGKTLVSTSTARLLSVTSGTVGTGDLVLTHNGTFASGITLSTGAINHVGTVTNSGSGSAGVVVSAPLGSAVTGMVQNSATSSLTLSGANTAYAGPLALSAGNLRIGSATALGGAGSPTGTGGTLTIAAGTRLDASVASVVTTRNAQIWQGDFTLGGALALNTGPGAITVTSPTLTVSSGTGTTALVTVPGAISGNTNLTVNVRGSVGFTFTGAIATVGTLTHSGSGAGTTTLTGG
ncbi:MAG: autotransporter-associated beta strand repeat-containing protein, partial [Gemmatimonadaceae bacterium]|nr:autotransporter-associated beta strand repeat-containing protein [Gemmatimonadaceae bacterium]